MPGDPSSLLVPSDELAIPGGALYAYGNSYLKVLRSLTPMRGIERVGSRIGKNLLGLNNFNYGIASTLMHDICSYAYGSFNLLDPNTGAYGVGTWAPAASNCGIAYLDCLRNDANYDNFESSAKAQAGAYNGLLALIRLLRSSSFLQDTNAAFVYDGTWAAGGPGNAYKGGTIHQTGTQNGAVTITTPVGTDFDIVAIGVDSFEGGFNGAQYSVTVDEVPYSTGTTNDVFAGAKNAEALSNNITGQIGITMPLCIGLHGLTNAAHTVVLKKTDAALSYLIVNGLLIQSPNPIQIAIPQLPQLTPAGYAAPGTNASWNVDQIYRGIVSNIESLFATDNSVKSFDPMKHGWSPNTCTCVDGTHPSDPIGTTAYADAFIHEMSKLGPRAGFTGAIAS
jgi:hypothetical protein